MFQNIFPGGSSASDRLQRDVVECEMRLAFYDDSTRSMLVLEAARGPDYKDELHQLVTETVRFETLVVSRHGSQLMRAPSFARRPNSGMLTAPDGSGDMRACPTVESRLRLLRARLALAEHPSTLRTLVDADDVPTQQKVIESVMEQYTSRLTYARWLLDALGRERGGESAEGGADGAADVEGSTPSGGGLELSALLLKPLQVLLTSNAAARRAQPARDGDAQPASGLSSPSSSAMGSPQRGAGLFATLGGSSTNLVAAGERRARKGGGVLVTEMDVLIQVRRPACLALNPYS